jgi:pimeloyl-ACP methyl ester carboxylesterase
VIPQPRPAELPNGQVVGVYEYGDPSGRPVMVFHGTPACGAGFDWADAPARERGLRLIAPDRPGVGVSTPLDGWRVADWPPIVTALADAVGVDRFAVWGYSGGGPYAVATAAAEPRRVVGAAIAAGMGEVGTFAAVEDFEKTDRQLLGLSVKHPRVARVVLAVSYRLAKVSPKTAYRSFEKQLNASDAKVAATLGEPKEAMALFTQAFLKSSRGVVDDYRSIARGWGVDFDSITVPVHIFQGTADTMVPLRHAEGLAKRIPHAELTTWPEEGHLGTVNHVHEILDWISSLAWDPPA